MNDEEINKLAQRIAKLVINNLHEGLISGLNDWDPDEEEDLLAELAKCMTLLDKYLKAEQYEKCEVIKNKIKTIEIKLHTDFVYWLFQEWDTYDVVEQMLFNEQSIEEVAISCLGDWMPLNYVLNWDEIKP